MHEQLLDPCWRLGESLIGGCFRDLVNHCQIASTLIRISRISLTYIQGAFFDWSALKMTKSQPLKEFSELVLPKND